MSASGTRAVEIVRRAGVDFRLHAYESPERHGRVREARPAYGLEAAEALGGRRADRADPAATERATGYVLGGISPLGSRRPLPVVLDDAAAMHPTVFVSAGRRGLQLELAPTDLARLARATQARIVRDL